MRYSKHLDIVVIISTWWPMQRQHGGMLQSFFNDFLIPVISRICVFYLIGNKTWMRCKLGARCVKLEDILN